MKALVFISAFIVIILTLMYFDSDRTIYDNWYKNSNEEVSLFSNEVTTTELITSKEDDDKYFIIYDDKNEGIYCKEIKSEYKEVKYKENMYSCTPMEVDRLKILDDAFLTDIIKASHSKNGFLAEIYYINFVLFKKLFVNIDSLDDSKCISDNECNFRKLDRYIAFKYDLFKKMFIVIDYEKK